MAGALKEIAGRVGIGLVYKTSFDKANRTSAKEHRGIGLDGALPNLRGHPRNARRAHPHRRARSAAMRDRRRGRRRAANPAFLCRQTDLLQAALPRPRGQREERTVPGALGHGERGRQDHRDG